MAEMVKQQHFLYHFSYIYINVAVYFLALIAILIWDNKESWDEICDTNSMMS